MRQVSRILALIAVGLLMGCGGDEDEPKKTAGAYDPPAPSGVAVSEQDACEMYAGALEQAGARLGCPNVEHRTCPDWIRLTKAPACSDWDKAIIDYCVQWIGTFPTCDDIANRPCLLTPIANEGCDNGLGGAGGEENGLGGAGGEENAEGGAGGAAAGAGGEGGSE